MKSRSLAAIVGSLVAVLSAVAAPANAGTTTTTDVLKVTNARNSSINCQMDFTVTGLSVGKKYYLQATSVTTDTLSHNVSPNPIAFIPSKTSYTSSLVGLRTYFNYFDSESVTVYIYNTDLLTGAQTTLKTSVQDSSNTCTKSYNDQNSIFDPTRQALK